MQIRMKSNKMICIILSVILSLSGLFYQDNVSDFLSANSTVEKTNSYIQSEYTTITEIQVCTAEILGLQNPYAIQNITGCFISPQGRLKISLSFLCLNSFLFVIGKFFTDSEIIQSYCRCLNELVTNYIHKSDGKKRI